MHVNTMLQKQHLINLLRTPAGAKQLHQVSEEAFISEDGERFPVIDGVVCLLKEDERGKDLGDAKFYEENPFGIRDWSDPDEIKTGVEKEIKDVLAKLPKSAFIADIGCGSGRVSNYMSLKGFENVVSVDYSLNSVKMVQRNSNNFCIWGNNLDLPLASDSFDFVISTGVIHHTPDPKRAFAECARVVKPGGLFFIKMRNLHSPYGYLFFTYGAALRFFERTKGLKWLSDLFGFQVYKLTRKVFYSHLPKRPDKELRGKYENLFIKDLITFSTTREVKEMIAGNNLEIQYGWKTQTTHRQHFYVCKKKTIE